MIGILEFEIEGKPGYFPTQYVKVGYTSKATVGVESKYHLAATNSLVKVDEESNIRRSEIGAINIHSESAATEITFYSARDYGEEPIVRYCSINWIKEDGRLVYKRQ